MIGLVFLPPLLWVCGEDLRRPFPVLWMQMGWDSTWRWWGHLKLNRYELNRFYTDKWWGAKNLVYITFTPFATPPPTLLPFTPYYSKGQGEQGAKEAKRWRFKRSKGGWREQRGQREQRGPKLNKLSEGGERATWWIFHHLIFVILKTVALRSDDHSSNPFFRNCLIH